MPIVVEKVVAPTRQDLDDLHKIYRDAPTWLFGALKDSQGLIDAGLEDGSLLAARFNDRLLGAARLRQQGEQWQLSHLCVRTLTRRRGVAERLVSEARRTALESGGQLQLLAPAGHLECQALAAKLHLPLDNSED
ncbi:acetyl-CoA sensor PanZ family protein [Pseudomonas sp. R5(2019)]|uniref:acetyl-CoA sensor PanZ family protein n=1 Tax=Pseudomonas sp. R5(2019) TaxID=2697566 RepID=UPI00141364DC|nr:acetyl-CoA sensor PanZ family protein [Pseudomonas sp. R5(2019)]NBA98386.1 acetyl-CoA sensor PanZ family protein [Pseudomonas sp. R5(2019)]